MFGKNQKRAPVKSDGMALDVQEIFATLQGEGPYAGWPSVFLRLGGCNLACEFCDTEFESFTKRRLDNVLSDIQMLANNEAGARVRHLVVITGGEPLRQNLVPLCEALLQQSFKVQIETNGTLFQPLPEMVDIICSPKMSGGKYHTLHPDLLARLTALKFIVREAAGDYQAVGEVGQSQHNIPVYVQPMDEYDKARNEANRAHALHLAQIHGYRLSLQTHKLLGIA
ncbi:MAG: 7-carboxy-7-deazaguanine synthase QueE [Alphaproteobacteria bacterium]